MLVGVSTLSLVWQALLSQRHVPSANVTANLGRTVHSHIPCAAPTVCSSAK